jgi:uncharacterized membrane protein YvbJ
MHCDGVIDFDPPRKACPHCGAAIDDHVKRYFNWVEINETNDSDAKALLRIALPFVIVLIVIVAAFLIWKLR